MNKVFCSKYGEDDMIHFKVISSKDLVWWRDNLDVYGDGVCEGWFNKKICNGSWAMG